MSRATKGFVKSHQAKVRTIFFKVDGTGTAALTFGGQHGTLTDSGTGHYTIALTHPGSQLVGLSVLPTTKVYAHEVGSTASSIVIKTFTDAGVAADADFYLQVTLSDSQYES